MYIYHFIQTTETIDVSILEVYISASDRHNLSLSSVSDSIYALVKEMHGSILGSTRHEPVPPDFICRVWWYLSCIQAVSVWKLGAKLQ